MANTLFEKGREGFLDGTLDWDTHTFKATLLDLNVSAVGVKTITGATNVTPIVVTATAHGFTNGDLVSIGGVLGNLAANGIWKIANQAANTFELTDPITSTNVAGSGTYTSGGYVANLGLSASGDNLDDFSACVVGTAQTLTSPTVVGGVANAANVTFPSGGGVSVEAILIYRDTGTASTSRVAAIIDGRHIVTCAATAATSATTVPVERLAAGIPNGTVLAFSNGQLATLTALANAGDRTVTVSALSGPVTAASRADAPATGSGLPATTSGQISITWDTGANKIFKL